MFKFSKEILHRGIDRESRNWIYGWAYGDSLETMINASTKRFENETVVYEVYPILPNTACRYTGLQDRKGKKIFEKDVLFNPVFADYWICEFDQGCWLVRLVGDNYYRTLLWDVHEDFEVIGDLYYNSEFT